jgi:excisionase family DNA binding protein
MSVESMWCSLHDEPVDWSKFEWKGCWGCQHFSGLDPKEHVYVPEAAELLGVTAQTVRRWIKTGVLNGVLYRRGRSQFSISSPPTKYVIDCESIERVLDKRGRPNTTSMAE